jgi:hypothetical protein
MPMSKRSATQLATNAKNELRLQQSDYSRAEYADTLTDEMACVADD